MFKQEKGQGKERGEWAMVARHTREKEGESWATVAYFSAEQVHEYLYSGLMRLGTSTLRTGVKKE